jgi:hypothetical protein
MAFDRAAAKASGYTDEEIDAFLQANPQVAKDTPPPPAGSMDEPPPPSTQVPDVDRTNEMLGVAGIGLGPVVATGLGGAALYQLGKRVIIPGIANATTNAVMNAMDKRAPTTGPIAPEYGTKAAPIGSPAPSPTARTVPVSGAVAPESVPVSQVARTATAPAAEAGSMLSRVAPYLETAGRMATPVARAAGPAGLALGAYGAGQFARDADLGGRLARGEGRRAPQAFRGMLNQNISGYTPTPQEAQNILASGDERMINIYGGRLRLQGLASPGPNAINSGYTQELTRLGR